jgi:hypothetical protein
MMESLDFIKLLNETSDPEVASASKDAKMWSNLKLTNDHLENKKKIDFMLRFTLLHMFWRDENAATTSEDECTSNQTIVEEVFGYKKFKLVKGKFDKDHVYDAFKVMTFSLTKKKPVVVDLHEWRATPDIITMTSGNEQKIVDAMLRAIEANKKIVK